MIILCGNVLLLRYMSLDMLLRVAVCSSASTERQGQDAPPDRRTIRPLRPIPPIGRGDTETT